MKDVFLLYGLEEDHAEICSEVLIEADKWDIDSYRLRRLKPIYCDRVNQNILYPSKPIMGLKESLTTALVDGNLDIELCIGPHYMQKVIDKAKSLSF